MFWRRRKSTERYGFGILAMNYVLNKNIILVLLALFTMYSPMAFSSDDSYMKKCLAELSKYTDTKVFNVSSVERFVYKSGMLVQVTFDKSKTHNASFSMCEFHKGDMFNLEFILKGIESKFTFNTLVYEKFYDEQSYVFSTKASDRVKYIKHGNEWLLN